MYIFCRRQWTMVPLTVSCSVTGKRKERTQYRFNLVVLNSVKGLDSKCNSYISLHDAQVISLATRCICGPPKVTSQCYSTVVLRHSRGCGMQCISVLTINQERQRVCKTSLCHNTASRRPTSYQIFTINVNIPCETKSCVINTTAYLGRFLFKSNFILPS